MHINGGAWEEAGRRKLVVRSLLLLMLFTGVWLAMMPLHDAVFAQHRDWLDALYLFFQIAPVYLGFALIGWTGVSLWRGRSGTMRDLGIVRFSAWWLVWVMLLSSGLLSCDLIWELVLGWVGLPVTSRASLIVNYSHLPISRAMMIALLCVVAPLGEEVLFRGMIFQWFAARLPLVASLMLSASIFAGMHLVFALGWDSGILSYFLTGLACAWLFWESRSLWPGILLHGSLNIVFVVVTLLK